MTAPPVWGRAAPTEPGFYWWRIDEVGVPLVSFVDDWTGPNELGGEWGPPVVGPEMSAVHESLPAPDARAVADKVTGIETVDIGDPRSFMAIEAPGDVYTGTYVMTREQTAQLAADCLAALAAMGGAS